MACNKLNGTNITTFEELLEYYYTKGYITDATEEAYWEKMNDIPARNICYVMLELFYNDQTGLLIMYQVINPDNELSDTYVATENGTYTFIVKDLMTGNSYAKSVEVTNVDSSVQQYYVDNVEYDYGIGLKSKETDEPTTFEGAYVVYEGETINITSLIEELDGANVIYDGSIADYLEDIGTIDFYLDLEGEEINIMLVKNGIYYMGTTVIDGLPS